MTIDKRSLSTTAGRFACEIDGFDALYCREVAGGDWETDVAVHDLGPDNEQMKQAANVKYAAFKAKFGIAQGGPMNEWISRSFAKSYAYRGGSITLADFDSNAVQRMDFSNALITSVTIPKLDGASKEPSYIDVEWEAEEIKYSPGSGKIHSVGSSNQKKWTSARFSFTLDGLEQGCSRVATVESFSWKQGVMREYIGTKRLATLHPTKVTVPDLKVSFAAATAKPWLEWAKAWFVEGNTLVDHHKTGAIYFLTPDGKDHIGTINLYGVGLKKLTAPPLGGNKEEIARYTAELYVERMTFKM